MEVPFSIFLPVYWQGGVQYIIYNNIYVYGKRVYIRYMASHIFDILYLIHSDSSEVENHGFLLWDYCKSIVD